MRRALVVLLVLAAVAIPARAQGDVSLPDLGATEITLSWQDFKRLVEAARVAPTPPPPPRGVVLRSAEYSGRLERGVLLLDASLQVDVLAEGWVRLPLWGAGAVVRFEGAGAVLSRGAEGLELIAQGPRRLEVRASLAFEASDHPGANRIDLTLPDAALNLLDVTAVPGLRELQVETGLAYRTTGGRVFAALDGGRATLTYTIPYRTVEADTGQEVQLEPRVLLTSYEFLTLGDGVVGGILVQDYQVRVAKVTDFEIGLDPGVEVFDAAAAGLESWKVLQRDDGRVLRVRLAAPADGTIRVVVTFDGAYDADEGVVAVPRFRPLGVERESGFVAVAADGAEVELGLTGNLLPADVTEIPVDASGYGGNLVTAFKYAGEPAAAVVTVIEHEDAAVLTAIVERLNASTVLLNDGTEATWLDLAIKNNRKQFLSLRLPADSVEVWSLMVDGEPARPKRTDDAVLVPLPTGAGERTSQISLVLLARGAEVPAFGTIRPSLPGLDVPIEEALWTIFLPPGPRYKPMSEAFRVLSATRQMSALPGAGMGMAAAAPSAQSDLSAYVSDELLSKQKVQEEQIQQQVVARQSAVRRGALPVRVGLPGGVTSLARISVARILIVDAERTVLPIRVYPGWVQPLLTILRLILVLGAGLLLGLQLGRRLPPQRRRWLPAAAVGAVLPFGAIGLGPAVVLALLTAGATALAAVVLSRLASRRHGTAGGDSAPPPLRSP